MYSLSLVIIPLLGGLTLLTSNSLVIHRMIAIVTSCLTFIFSLYLLSIDQGYVTLFVILTTLTIPSALLSGWESVRQNSIIYYSSMLLLETCLLAVFLCDNVIIFYVSFEAALIPLFVLITLFGGEGSVRASYLLFLYTLVGSLSMLIGLLLLVEGSGSVNFDLIKNSLNGSYNFAFLLILLALAVKTPLSPLHIWLQRAHAEAPVGGSIVLAGLVLKLATFGYLRLLLDLLPQSSSHFAPVVQTIGIVSIIYSSLSALRQVDSKALIAVSSVAHMSIVLLGLFSNSLTGITGAIILAIAHGLISPALFFLIGGVLYDRFHVRVIRYYRGLISRMPLFAMIFLIASIANAGVPLSVNFVGEIMAMIGTFERSPSIGAIAAFSVVLAASYSLWIYARITMGHYSPFLIHSTDLSRRELHVLLPWIILALLFGIYPQPIIKFIIPSISLLLY